MANRCHSGQRCQNAGIGAADESSAASDVKCTLHWAGPKTPRETGQTKASRENGNNCLELQTPLRHCCQQTHSASQPLLRLYLPWTTRRSSRHHQRFQLIVSTLHSSSSSRGTPHPRMEAVHILNFSGSIYHLWGAVSKWVFISFPPFLFCLLNYSALFYFILFPPWSIFLYRPSGIMSQELKFNLVFKFASPRIDFAARRRTFSGLGFKNEIYGQLFKKYMCFVWNFWFTSN